MMRSVPFSCLVFAVMLVALGAIFLWVPTEKEMGIVQRIFYFHVPAAFSSFLAFFLVFVGSIQYLRTREDKWDRLALCSAELGVIFALIVLITGPLWAKP
ncbi:MAG: cytochrome C assembly protein, partial [Gammaproteobacteria bacterium]|nr:cytochrome C assembly protein [Gammaproteobacteria bacterium]